MAMASQMCQSVNRLFMNKIMYMSEFYIPQNMNEEETSLKAQGLRPNSS